MTDAEIIALHDRHLTVTEIAKLSSRKLDDVRRVLVAAGHYRRA